MAVINVTKENFADIVNSAKPVLLDFYAIWCGPCKMVSPLVEQIADENSEFTVGKIDVDEQAELAAQFGVISIPTLVVMKNGKVTAQEVGFRPKPVILDMLKS